MNTPDSIQERAGRGLSLRDTALVIDAHAHLGGTMSIHTHAAQGEALIASMDRIGIRTTCASSMTALGESVQRGNDEIAAAVKNYPGRFAGYAVINPNDPIPVETELERCLESGGHWAVKIHPTLHAYPSDGAIYRRVYAWLQRRGGVVLSHIFESPAVLARLSAEYPDVVFILAHAASHDGRTPFPFAPLIRERQNVYADLTLSVVSYGGVEALVQECRPEKLLWASDTPFLDYAHQIGRLTHASLGEADKRLILGENMQRLLRRYWKEVPAAESRGPEVPQNREL